MIAGARRFKSPPYPYLDLKVAIERAEQLGLVARGFAVPVATIAKAWSYSPSSSSTAKVLGALNQFGLIEDEGSGDTKGYRLSNLGDQIVRDNRPDSEERDAALKQAALSPKVFAELWEKFRTAEVDVDTLKHELTLGRKRMGRAEYSDAAAEEVAERYRASLLFAGIDGGNDEIEPEDERFERDASTETLHSIRGGAEPARYDVERLEDINSHASDVPQSTQFKREVFATENGDVVLTWPSELSADSYLDISDWLKIVLRKMERAASK